MNTDTIELAVGQRYYDKTLSREITKSSRKAAEDAINEMLLYPDVFGNDGSEIERLLDSSAGRTAVIIEIDGLSGDTVITNWGKMSRDDFLSGIQSGEIRHV